MSIIFLNLNFVKKTISEIPIAIKSGDENEKNLHQIVRTTTGRVVAQ